MEYFHQFDVIFVGYISSKTGKTLYNQISHCKIIRSICKLDKFKQS